MQSQNTDPSKQDWILDQMDKLGYSLTLDGVCFGLAHMAMQAVLVNDLETFNARLNLIRNISPDQLQIRIKEVNNKIISLSETAKNKKIDVQELLTPEERLLISIPPFFEGISLHQKPEAYPDVFEIGQKPDLDSNLVEEIVRPEDMKDKAIKLATFSNAYNVQMLRKYLYSLLRKLISRDISNIPVAFVLVSPNHAIAISYDSKQGKWSFTDANKSQTKFYNEDKLAEKIIAAFSKNNQAVFTTNIFCAESNRSKLDNSLSAWVKLSNTLTDEKIKIADSENRTLIDLAIVNDDLPLLNELLLKGADPTLPFITNDKYNGLTPLHMAVEYENRDMVKAIVASLMLRTNIKPEDLKDAVENQTSALMKATPDLITESIESLGRVASNRVVSIIESYIQREEIDRIKNQPNADKKIEVWKSFIDTIKHTANANKPIIDIYNDWKNVETVKGIRNIDVIEPSKPEVKFFHNQLKSESYDFLNSLLNSYGHKKPVDIIEKEIQMKPRSP